MRYGLMFAGGAALLAGCTSTQTVQAPDGMDATMVECNGDILNMDDCRARAARVCAPRGYTVLDSRDGMAPVSAYSGLLMRTTSIGNVHARSLTIRCELPPTLTP